MSGDSPHLRTYASPEEAADSCGEYILDALANDLRSQARATLAISGGNTPKLLFARMAAAKFDWSRVHIFWVDERCVPPTDSQSNYRLANETLLTACEDI